MFWNKHTVRRPQAQIEELKKRLSELNLGVQTAATREEALRIRSTLEKLYDDMDIYWRQRSRVQWIREGDRNTGFFHAKATIRHKNNRVDKIRDQNGVWRDEEEIESIIANYFDQIFTSTNPDEGEIDEVLEALEPRVTSHATQMLSLPFSEVEFGSIHPSRGLRQGDPLSPYLFICCAEALILMIHKAVADGNFHGIKIAPTAPTISNLCFAADTLHFCQATEADARTMKGILETYARISGQEINYEKTTMCFSPTTPQTIKNSIHGILGFQIVDRHDKYLGMPASMGRTRKDIFNYLRDRLWARIRGWGEKQLSRAGKEVLIKSVLQAIPTYLVSCFMLPCGLLSGLESAIRKFWWGNGNGKSMAWMSWSKMCLPKAKGGLGFRHLKSFNLALLAKQTWRILINPDLLISKILKARYFPNSEILTAWEGSRPSATWKCILKARQHLVGGIRRRIGDGNSISIWADPWLADDGNFKIITRRPFHTAKPDRVSELIDDTTGAWNKTLIDDLFWPVDRDRILAIPIGARRVEDIWIWHYSNHGRFTVRSCYHNIIAGSQLGTKSS